LSSVFFSFNATVKYFDKNKLTRIIYFDSKVGKILSWLLYIKKAMQKLHLLPVLLLVLSLFISCSDDDNNQQEPTTVTDIDGNVYNTITIGNQTWMLENLKVTTFNDGTPITLYEFSMDWLNLNNPQSLYQWANTDDLNNAIDFELPFDYYGAMYNHLALESGKLAPEGWRIPTTQDFIELEAYLNANGYAGIEATSLKSDSGWLSSSGNGTNEIGFNGLPNGYVSAVGTPTASEIICTWATSDVESNFRSVVQLFDESEILYSNNSILLGAGVRCIKIEN
jgi:uncharacterized protein (TIGR02145 family)